MKKFDDFRQLIDGNHEFVLVGHEDPDGDSLGSLLALGEYLEGQGKSVKMTCKSQLPEIFNYLRGVDKVCREFDSSRQGAIILLDNGDLKRTGFSKEIQQAKKRGLQIVNIDHHIRNDIWKIATLNLAETMASSTSELVFKLLTSLKANINPSMATALLTGMYYDTGGFHHSNTSDEVLKISSELLRLGANLKKISKSVSQNRSLNMLKLWGIALDRIKLDSQRSIATTVLTRRDIVHSGANEEEISGLVNLLNSASEVKMALLLYETEDGKIKGSLRTENNDVDVAKLAGAMGGGGHKKASGFSLKGKLMKIGNNWQVM